MSSGFAWLNELMAWLGRWVPRLVLVKRGFKAVCFGPGGSVETLEPGLHVYWPITHEVTPISVLPRTFEIAGQVHGSEVIVVAVGYRLADPALALTSVNDVQSNLDDRTQRALAHHVREENITDLMQAELAEFFTTIGVEIQWVTVIQRGSVIALKNINDWANHEPAIIPAVKA